MFELEVLREILSSGLQYNSASDPAMRVRLACLPPTDLPLLRRCAAAEDRGQDIREALYTRINEQGLRQQLAGFSNNRDRTMALELAYEVRESIERRVRD